MRVFKKRDNSVEAIVGEMLNKETSTLHWIDGTPTTETSQSAYTGYPRLVDNTIVYNIKAAYGYVFVSPGTDIHELKKKIIDTITSMELKMIRPDGVPVFPLSSAHTIAAGYHTNIKTTCSLAKTTDKPVSYAKGSTLPKRLICEKLDDIRNCRFAWIIKTIDKFESEITSQNLSDSVAHYVCSVFYDSDDISTYEHNETTFEYSVNRLRGSANILQQTVAVCNFGNPLMCELSNYWREYSNYTPSYRNSVRNISDANLYEGTLREINLRKVDTGGEPSNEVCTTCRSLLWGDIYVFKTDNIGEAKCPMCVHTTLHDDAIEKKFRHVLRVAHTRTVHDMIEQLSGEHKEICKELVTGFEKKTILVSGKKIKYAMIGSKYIAFTDTKKYLYSSLVNDPEFSSRTVVGMYLVKK